MNARSGLGIETSSFAEVGAPLKDEVMLAIDVSVRLTHFQIVHENATSRDEPFLWVLGIKFDSVTAGDVVQRPTQAALEFHVPSGDHRNLGIGATRAEHARPVAIPEAVGKWTTALRFDPLLTLSQPTGPMCTLVIAAVALEEHSTPDAQAVENHRRAMSFIKSTLISEVRAVLREAVASSGENAPDRAITVERLRDVVGMDAIRAVIDTYLRDQLPATLTKAFASVLLPLVEHEHDEFVGQDLATFTMPELIANALDGQEIQFELNRNPTGAEYLRSLGIGLPDNVPAPALDAPRTTGHYRVLGRVRRADLREPPTLGAVWHPEHFTVFARGDERKVRFARTRNGGNDFLAFPSVGAGMLTSGTGAAASADGRHTFVCGRGDDMRIWGARCTGDVAALKKADWDPILTLKARYGASVAMDGTGRHVYVFAVDEEHRVHWAVSNDGGERWHMPWGYVGLHRLDATPAVAMSPDRRHLNLFGLGTDRNIWRAYSRDGDPRWDHLWTRSGLPELTADSAPACAVSADGQQVFVIVKAGHHYRFLRSEDAGRSWHEKEWVRMRLPGDGYFISAPTVCASPDLRDIQVFGIYSDMQLYFRTLRGNEASGWERVSTLAETFA